MADEISRISPRAERSPSDIDQDTLDLVLLRAFLFGECGVALEGLTAGLGRLTVAYTAQTHLVGRVPTQPMAPRCTVIPIEQMCAPLLLFFFSLTPFPFLN